jgi:hypothetical protein
MAGASIVKEGVDGLENSRLRFDKGFSSSEHYCRIIPPG